MLSTNEINYQQFNKLTENNWPQLKTTDTNNQQKYIHA